MTRLRPWLAPLAAMLAALAVLGLLLLVLGAHPGRALGALASGALGDRLAISNTVLRMFPLALVGLGVAFISF